MKKLMVLAVLLFSVVHQRINAQVRVSVNLNIGNQPDWGPTGYDHVDYYYLPDMDVYYNVPQHLFIYAEGSRWIYARSLPPRYNGYNLYNSYKVVVNKPRPYLHANNYRGEYGRYKGGNGPSQVIIRDSHDDKYNNHYNNNMHKDHGRRNDNGHGNIKDHGHGNNGDHGHSNGKGHDDH
jgi:hypothetical protein